VHGEEEEETGKLTGGLKRRERRRERKSRRRLRRVGNASAAVELRSLRV
jgi:hypothetical protein